MAKGIDTELMDKEEFRRIREAIPGILINCLPKSASDYIRHALSSGLGKSIQEPTGGRFPDNRVRPGFIAGAYDKGWLMRGHIAPNRYNVIEVKTSIPRMVVHVRDPRSAFLSFIHTTLHKAEKSESFRMYHRIDRDFFAMSLDERACFFYEAYFIPMIDWIKGWLEVDIRGGES